MNNKRLNLLPVWAAISAVIIIAGIVLMALLGFNDSLDRPESKNFDVYYNVVVDLSEERKATLEGYCEDAFAAQGIAYEEKTTLSGQTDPVSQNQSSFTGTGNDFVLRYTFSADVSDEALAAAKAAVEANIGGNQEFSPDYNGAETFVSYYTLELQAMNESVWRGAIAVAVGAIVALIYVAIRFGMGCALTGLVACVNDAFLTLSVFAIARIPVYTFAPMLYAAIAAVASAVFWLIRCMKLREDAKDPAAGTFSAEESVANACAATDKPVWLAAGLTLAVIAVCAACTAVTGAAAVFAGALIPVAAGLYSSMLLAPSLHVKVKAHFDKLRKKHVRYEGKKKGAKADVQS